MTPRNIDTNLNVRVDTAINEAASRITSAKPSDALRANVMSRVAAEQPARFPWRFVLAGGAIASVALVAFVSWPSNPAISQSTISNPTLINPTVINSRVSTADPTAVPNVPSPLTSVVGAARVERIAAQTDFAMSDAEFESSELAPAALDRPDPLETVKSLDMKPIDNITPLGVAPLLVPVIGDGSNR